MGIGTMADSDIVGAKADGVDLAKDQVVYNQNTFVTLQKPFPIRPVVSTIGTEDEFRNFHAKIAASNAEKYGNEAETANSASEVGSLDSSSSSSTNEESNQDFPSDPTP